MLENRSQRWALSACFVLIVLALALQAVHVHAFGESSGGTCVACVTAHSTAPVTAIFGLVLFVAVTWVLSLGTSRIPHCDTILPLFIRPPPAR